MTGIQRALRSAVLKVSGWVSRFLVRPEADRLLRLLSEPIIESGAYTNRALRDLEARVGGSGDELLAMHAFRALHDLAGPARVLLVGAAPPLLERALVAVGCDVARLDPGALASVRPGDYEAVVLFGARAPRGWGRVSRLPVEGAQVAIARRP